jgi:hypothetical protein
MISGVWLGWFCWVKSSWFGSCHAAGVKPVCMVLSLATGEMLVSVGQF